MVTRIMSASDYEKHQAKYGRKAAEHLLASAGTVMPAVRCNIAEVAKDFAMKTALIAKKRSKYGNVKTVVDGVKLDSKREAKRYRELGLLLKGKKIDFLARQVRFRLPGGVTYVADFVYGCVHVHQHIQTVLHEVTVEDAKGHRTREFINKKKQMLSEYQINVEEV